MPAEAVVTSFSSKSELGLHLAKDWRGTHVVFVGYAGAGVGALDVSNSDAVPGQDPTNPVTFAFGSTYAFPRTIVSMDEHGRFDLYADRQLWRQQWPLRLAGTQRALLHSRQCQQRQRQHLSAPAQATNLRTSPRRRALRLSIRSMSVGQVSRSRLATRPRSIPCFNFSSPPSPTSRARIDNYRGITEYGGTLYFTKGSGSNGVDTVYTVNSLPTLADAASTKISIAPGFPSDSAKSSGGDFTPFAVFFANPTTMYVTDEGSGNATDVASHAGLEKWSLVNGVWTLDYVLTKGLIGVVDGNLTGYDGQYPDVTTVGLRNLTGVVHRDGTVTLWATTSTSSASSDPGADPNKVVRITDRVAATTLTGSAANESFSTVAGPTYGKVYRGVAYAD